MAILEIKKYPNKILRKKSEEVKEITEDIKKLGQEMIETMIQNKGIGLAGTQVGELKRIITIWIENRPQVFINPQIVKKTKETGTAEEGCLCFPGLFLNIKRARGVGIKALDETGNEIQINAEGLLARILQHEIDHLNGILFIDKLGFWRRWKIRNILKKFKKSNAAN